MAQQHSINGTNVNYISFANWIDRPEGMFFTGETPVNRWKRHIWQSNVMTVAEYQTIYDLEGSKVTIVTTAHADRNGSNYATYYEAELKRVSATHVGPLMQNVRAEFLVRV